MKGRCPRRPGAGLSRERAPEAAERACAKLSIRVCAGKMVLRVCGRSVVVAQKPSKLLGRVRFPSPA